MIARGPTNRAAIGLAAAGLVAGCGPVSVSTPADDASQAWSDHPLVPDPALATEAMTSHSACLMETPPGQVRILVQDRRAPQTAAFLVASPTMFGSCLVTIGTGGMAASSGGGGSAPGAMAAALSIDSSASGGSTHAQNRLLGGRVVHQAAQVVVALADGRSVVASLNNGYWLAWWPDTTTATTVEATDAAGARLAIVRVDQ